ncbi:hypothetical protein NHX12_014951 [Muraenolepis orangiensis]|uniref:Uncharacterized protein n=1 Tax=Muraenolepis orangiensis TaxID=630683 RepID=A0A9Q0I5L0_9TELE|nr:hypothetical protein NHX12_014951 [Muraenolepis orangiensis]
MGYVPDRNPRLALGPTQGQGETAGPGLYSCPALAFHPHPADACRSPHNFGVDPNGAHDYPVAQPFTNPPSFTRVPQDLAPKVSTVVDRAEVLVLQWGQTLGGLVFCHGSGAGGPGPHCASLLPRTGG